MTTRKSNDEMHQRTDLVRILVVDDHPVFRKGAADLLNEAFKNLHIDETGDGREAIRMACEHDWELVILDVTLPGRNGLDVLKDIRHQRPRIPVLMVSMHPEDQYALRALRAGASGYMTKDTAPEALVMAVDRILDGGRYVSSSLADRLAQAVGTGVEGPLHESLSDREHQVLVMLGGGHRVSDIATALSLSVKTVSTYRARVLEKLDLSSTAELIAYALRQGLVE